MKIKSIPIKKETAQNLKKIMEMVRPGDSMAFMMYGSPDPDAIASALAMHRIIQQTRGLTKYAFVATEPLARQQNIALAEAMRLNIQLINKVDLTAYRLTALFDAQPSFFKENIPAHMVFDHHPREGQWQADLEDIRTGYGALSSIMTEYLLCSRVYIPRNLHTALMYGIKTDTNNFNRDTIFEDISAYTHHSKRANIQLIQRIELNQTPKRFLKYFDHAYHYIKTFPGGYVCNLGVMESADVGVQVADFYLRLIGVNYVIISGIVGDKFIIIFRGDGYRRDCGALAQKTFGDLGSGGGHRSAARMEIPLETLRQKLNDDLSQKNIDRFLLTRLKRKQGKDKDEV
jgi:nanoRNase/pAp phosphatase (c-di-AMP/oligoRNAs hydrolase)